MERRVVIGVCMGGYAALVLALRHPDLYSFAGALSPPVNITSVPLTWKHPARSLMLRRIFGGPATEISVDVQPAALVRKLDCEHAPYLFVSAGAQEPLLRDIQPFADLLRKDHFRYTFQVRAGGHDWKEWNEQLPGMLEALRKAPQAKCPAT